MTSQRFAPPSPPRQHKRRFGSARAVMALILREMATTYGRSPGGYLWAIIEPVFGIAILSLVFSALVRAPALGISFPMFYATGMLPFLLYSSVQGKVAGGLTYSRALLAYPDIEGIRHVHHAGNSSGVVDGGSAVLLASPEYARAHGMKPRARVIMTAVAGTEPVIMLTAPGPAATKCVENAGMSFDDIDLFEVNEAFAAVVLKFLRDTGVDPTKVNVNGGAIALGHPIGATGGMLIGTLLDELERQDLSTGLVTMCTGGGMGTATIIERF